MSWIARILGSSSSGTHLQLTSGISQEGHYDAVLDYTHDKYFSKPSSLESRPITEAQAARRTYYDAMGRDAGGSGGGSRTGARTIRSIDAGHHNASNPDPGVPKGRGVY